VIKTRSTGIHCRDSPDRRRERAVTACSPRKVNRDVVALGQFALDARGLTIYCLTLGLQIFCRSPEPSVRSNTTRLLVRNVAHLAVGQVVTTAIAVLLTAVIGRALEPAQFGIFYTVFAISSFVYVIVEWGQGTYLVREMARGRVDEPELIGSALLMRLAAIVVSSMIAVAIALAMGYSGEIVWFTLLAVVAGIPGTLSVPLGCSFRGRDRMDIDAFATSVGKAITLIATYLALRFGGGLTEVILMGGAGGIATLLVAIVAASRLDIAVKAPVTKAFGEIFRHGAPLAAFSLVLASQSFLDILLLSILAGPTVVGWYGALRSIFGIVISPAMILLGATFPALSRASRSLPDLQRMIDATGRIMFIAAASTSSALYLFAGDMVAIVFGHGRFEQTASLLRVSAIFIPLLFFVMILASAMNAVGRNKEMAVISIVRVTLCAVMNWLIIGYWQQKFGNGAIALVIIAGLAEIPATIACMALLPKGAVGLTTKINFVRANVASLCTVVPLSMLQPIGLFYLAPLFVLVFALTAMVTRLVVPSDLRLAMELVRGRVSAPQEVKSAPDG
jgi:O-antigen/teichoic acid export membrane protein